MAYNIYPLSYKPGILRDGTIFQSDYCTDGQWVRFKNGHIRKMGAMKGIIDNVLNNNNTTSDITIIPSTGNNPNMFVYVANIENGIHRYEMQQDLTTVNRAQISDLVPPHSIWQSEIIIQNNNKLIVYLNSVNLANINSNANATLIAGPITGELVPIDNPPDLKGLSGLLYAANYLFVYGANGLVQWSKLSDPIDFSNSAARSITISNDQVIDAKAIRGGTNTPTILFWTLTSVVRCINTGAADGELEFQIDTISKSSSVLSTRCVVEYDGLFFWPGTNRFFQYNGVVQELANTINLDYFFNNIDMARRQQVVGVKNTKYGEIWWFYPERSNSSFRDPQIPIGQNSRALVYNIRDNAWYDTSISRSTAVYSEDFGFMASYGLSLTDPTSGTYSLFRHEIEYLTPDPSRIVEYVPNGLNFDINPIPSTFTTPVFSWAAFNPMKQLTGTDRWVYLVTIEPDFTLMSAIPDMVVIVNGRQYAQSNVVSSIAYPIPPVLASNINDPRLAKIDIAYQGRHMTLTFNSTETNFELGHIMLTLGIGDGQ
jgi:hypothetical protein